MKNLVISSSSLGSAQICPRLYKYSSVLEKTPLSKPSYFQEGEILHKIFEIYFKKIMRKEEVNFDLIFELALNYAAETENINLTSEELDSVITDCKMYFNHYNRQGMTWKIIGVEEPFARELYVDDQVRIIYQGKIDLLAIADHGNGPRIAVDHKYEARFNARKDRDNQPMGYCWAFGIRDFVFNRIGKQKSYTPDKRLERPWLSYNEFQIDEWVESAIHTAMEIVSYAEKDYWPARMTGCGIYGKRCTFYDVCNTTPDNREYKLEALFGEKVRFDLMGEGD